VLLASRLINNKEPLLISNSDEIVDMDLRDFISDAGRRYLDGSILTFYADHPKWSYAHVGTDGFVDEVREKIVISSHATAGLYFFRQGRFFVTSAETMIAANDRVNHEFYVAPTYNYAVRAGLKIGIYEIASSQMFGLGTPEDLEAYKGHLENSELVR
jgi:dTDP-glucose pyrophosphorylase